MDIGVQGIFRERSNQRQNNREEDETVHQTKENGEKKHLNAGTFIRRRLNHIIIN